MGQSTPVVTAEFYDHRKAFDYWGIYGSALIGGAIDSQVRSRPHLK